MPYLSAIVPLASLAATSTAPFSTRKRAACLPTEPKALDDDPRASQRQPDMFPRYIDRDREAKADDADLVERDAAKLAGEANGTAGLVLDPSHRQLVGPHIGPGDVIREIAHRRCKGTDQPFLGRERHLGIGKYHRFAAAVRAARRLHS